MAIKLVGFDWDGTLAKMPVRSSWGLIDSNLDCIEARDALSESYKRKEFGYQEWCRRCVGLYMERGLTERMLRGIVEKNITLHKGALETVNGLRSRGIRVGIISGGLVNMYEFVSDRFGLSVDYANFATKLEFDRGSGALTGGKYTEDDYDGKLRVLKKYCKMAGATLEETLYVGDSDNDIPVFKAAAGIAFSSDSEELKRRAKHVIKSDDLGEVLNYVD